MRKACNSTGSEIKNSRKQNNHNESQKCNPTNPNNLINPGSDSRIYTDPLFVFAEAFELYNAARKCEQGIVGANADIESRMKFRAALANEDVAGKDVLAAVFLYSQ